MKRGWVPCSERMPMEHVSVLCFGEDGQFVGTWENGRWWVDPPITSHFILPGVFLGNGGPTHWRKLPKPPED